MTSALRVLAFASAAIGLGCAAWAARTAPELLKRMDQRRAELRELADLDVRSKQYDPYWRALAAAGGLPEPEDLFRRGAPDGPAPVVSEGAAEPLDEGWRLRRVEMVIADAPADSLGALIQACGTSRPPWRVSALRVQSLDPGSLRARATIALEGADRGGSGEDATP
jgi:hypothetical protein